MDFVNVSVTGGIKMLSEKKTRQYYDKALEQYKFRLKQGETPIDLEHVSWELLALQNVLGIDDHRLKYLRVN